MEMSEDSELESANKTESVEFNMKTRGKKIEITKLGLNKTLSAS